jgi:archaeal flagellar protein FlaI
MYKYMAALDRITEIVFNKRRPSDVWRVKVRYGSAEGEISLDCSSCSLGCSSVSDPACRRCLTGVLSGRGDAEKLLPERDLVREYSGDALSALKDMASFSSDLELRRSSLTTYGCGRCDAIGKKLLGEIVDASRSDAADAASAIDRLYIDNFSENRTAACEACRPALRFIAGRNGHRRPEGPGPGL